MVTFSKCYARKQKWVCFSEHSVFDDPSENYHKVLYTGNKTRMV